MTPKWIPRGTQNRPKIDQNPYLDPTVAHWVTQGHQNGAQGYQNGAQGYQNGAQGYQIGTPEYPKLFRKSLNP